MDPLKFGKAVLIFAFAVTFSKGLVWCGEQVLVWLDARKKK